jgi:hypothetical protein
VDENFAKTSKIIPVVNYLNTTPCSRMSSGYIDPRIP